MTLSNVASLDTLLARLTHVHGSDPDLDTGIAECLDNLGGGVAVPTYTASVDSCLELLHRCLPDWHWHLGYGASGVLPYAVVARADQRFEATAPTVPLALLMAIVKARLAPSPAP